MDTWLIFHVLLLMSDCLCISGILKSFDEILLLHCFFIDTPPLSGEILITTVLHKSIQCSDTTSVTGAKAIPKIESKYNTLSFCLLLWLLASSLWLLIYCGLCLSLTDFCSPSLNVSFFSPRELTPHLCYLSFLLPDVM